jgi:hypothetical protein
MQKIQYLATTYAHKDHAHALEPFVQQVPIKIRLPVLIPHQFKQFALLQYLGHPLLNL